VLRKSWGVGKISDRSRGTFLANTGRSQQRGADLLLATFPRKDSGFDKISLDKIVTLPILRVDN
jgi:hypothetical protein